MSKTFDELMDGVIALWARQQELAKEAEELYDKGDNNLIICNDLEQEMFNDLETMKEIDEDCYQEFVESFGIKKEEN